MACRIERNTQGQVEAVFTQNGPESQLFKQIQMNLGYDPESALVAYLAVEDYLQANNINEENITLSSPIVQRIIQPFKNDPQGLEDQTKNLKEDMMKSKVGDSLNYLLEKLGVDINIVNNLLLVNYIYLDVDERRKFSELKHEYLIEQVQFTGEEILYEGVNHINLNYNHYKIYRQI